jgi:hypothetical protein
MFVFLSKYKYTKKKKQEKMKNAIDRHTRTNEMKKKKDR